MTNPACPKCGQTVSVYAAKAELGGGWFCWAKKGGCGLSWGKGSAPVTVATVQPQETIAQAVTRVAQDHTAVEAARPVGPPTTSLLPVGTVEVVTTLGTFNFPPRSTYLLQDGWLRIKNPAGEETEVFNAVIVNRVRFHLR